MSTATKAPRLKTVSRGRLTGQGATAAEAKADLTEQTDRALHGSYTPVILSHGGWTAVVYREPDGWSYSPIDSARLTAPGLSDYRYTQFVGDRAECIQSAAYHVIQNGCDSDAVRTDADLPAFLTDPKRRAELLGWCRFQRAWRWARANVQGTDTDWHRWACENSRDERFA